MRNEENQDWERVTGESSKAYKHFCLYRDMGLTRSIRQMPSVSGCTSVVRQLCRWSSRWRWVERCQRYDDYAERQLRVQQEKERVEMHKRHSRIAILSQNIAVKGLERLLGKVQANEVEVAPGDLVRLVDTSVKVERISRGEPASGPVNEAIEGASSMTAIAISVRYEHPQQLPGGNGSGPIITTQRSGNNGDGA